jgi:uncharacterized protein YdaU (DUF1376 family)
MSADPWFRFFPSDWLGGTSGLSAAEKGVYVTLIAAIYDCGGPIKRDDARLARQCGLPKAGFSRALSALIECGKIEFDGQWLCNSRAKSELSEREIKIASAREGARVTNEIKSNKSNNDSRPSDRYSAQNGDAKTSLRAGAQQPQPPFPEANASGPKPPEKSPQPVYSDARHELWGEGKRMLAELGIPNSRAGPLIGQWVKEAGDDCPSVLDAIRRAREHKAVDPIAWIVRALPNRKSNESTSKGSISDAGRRLIRELDEQAERDMRSEIGRPTGDDDVLLLPSFGGK